MLDLALQSLTRLRLATTQRATLADLPGFIERNTFLNGQPYSFARHEYQRDILLKLGGGEVVVRKCAQTGISETALRAAACLPLLMPGAFAIGYVLPSATFASQYAATRFAPIITSSPALASSMRETDVDRADVKTFTGGDGATRAVYFKGAASGNAAISTSLDMLICDELSFCDPGIIGDYTSRLQHSPYKWRLSLSTPTVPGDPIDAAFAASRRHWRIARCAHCGEAFRPDYYEHVRVPGWGAPLQEITRDNLHATRWREAYLACPKCGQPADLAPPRREWVCENPGDAHSAIGFQVTPFDAPAVITIPALVQDSTRYATRARFVQFGLGLPAQDETNGLTQSILDAAGIAIAQTPFATHAMGIDLGTTCHFVIGGAGADGRLGIVHMERVPLARFRERYWALKAQYRVTAVVCDAMPYLDLTLAMTDADPAFHAAFYTARSGMDIFEVRLREAEPEKATQALRQVQIARNTLMDKVMGDIRDGHLWLARTAEWPVFCAHALDMRRTEAQLRGGEFGVNWVKSAAGQDHYWHALGYCWVAAQLRQAAQIRNAPGMFGIQSFRLRGAD